MKKRYHFLSGLPRSGSSLLSAILNQNPRFYCGPNSPVMMTTIDVEKSFERNELYHAYQKESYKNAVISSLLDQYYADVDKPVVFDRNRSWTARLEYIPKYFGDKNFKVLCVVRDLSEILASFISMIHRTSSDEVGRLNFIDQAIAKAGHPINDFVRCQYIAADGPLGRSYSNLEKAVNAGFLKNMHFVEYRDLTTKPQETMKRIYEFLGESYYEHSFDNLKNIHPENDKEVYGLPDMHHVRSSIDVVSKDPKDVLPAKVIEDVTGLEFWRTLDKILIGKKKQEDL